MTRAGGNIGPYRLVRRLGVGGMAEAFEAERPLSERCVLPVCIKRVLPAFADDPEYVSMFRREAVLAAQLHHPNVVTLLDVGTDHDQPYLVLELVDGIDLRALLQTAPGQRLSEEVVLYLAAELAHALDYAHTPDGGRAGLVHRDLSPSNVLLGRGGEVKLADFGLAKPLVGALATQSGAVRGKLAYLAPEQMRGLPVDGRADLFSLGVVLYQCLAGVRPFDGAHDVETMTRILGDRRRPLRELAPDVSPALAAIVDRLLAAAPEERYPSAASLLDALRDLPSPANGRFALVDLIEGRLGGPEARRHLVPTRSLSATGAAHEGDRAQQPEPEPEPAPSPPPALPADAPPSSAPARSSLPDTPAAEHRTSSAPPPPARRRGLPRPLVAIGLAAGAALFVAVGMRLGLRERSASTAATVRATAPTETTTDLRPSAARPGAGVARPTVERSTPASAPEPEPRTAPARTTAAEAVAAHAITPPPPPPAAASPSATVATVATDAASQRTTLRVFVVPWGRIWVDGVQRGRAPLTLSLEPGTHRIAAGQEEPTVERRVRLDPGESRTVELDLASADAPAFARADARAAARSNLAPR